jgi:hypothetical protein
LQILDFVVFPLLLPRRNMQTTSAESLISIGVVCDVLLPETAMSEIPYPHTQFTTLVESNYWLLRMSIHAD